MSPAERPWFASEELLLQQEEQRRAVDAGSFDGSGVFGAYYAYRTGKNRDWVKLHAWTDDDDARAYAQALTAAIESAGGRIHGEVADVACGLGVVTNALHEFNLQGKTIGIDIGEDAILAARARFPGLEFRAESVEMLPDRPERYHLIHSREFYPFTRTEDPQVHLEWLRCFARALRPGAWLALQMYDGGNGLIRTFDSLAPQLRAMGFDACLSQAMCPRRIETALHRGLPRFLARWASSAAAGALSMQRFIPASRLFLLRRSAAQP